MIIATIVIIALVAISILFIIIRRAVRLAVRLAFMAVLLAILIVGALAAWWYMSIGSDSQQKDTRPATTRPTSAR